jgi:hypothetical protein
METMPVLQSIASTLLSRRAARRLGRVIPNPVVRFVAVTAATALVPVLVERAAHALRSRRAARGQSSRSRSSRGAR